MQTTSHFLVAHRAGNDLRELHDAARLRARLVECDLRLWRGRIEVRHLKTVGPLPIYWDTWTVSGPGTRHLQLHELLEAVDRLGIELMLDLKGRNLELARRVRRELAGRPRALPVTVCARSWRLLDPFEPLDGVRTVRSIGSRRGLRRLLAERRDRRIGGVSIHADLLDASTVARLREAAEVIMTWPVNDTSRARTLLAWGVHGLITDEAPLIAPLVAAPIDASAAA